MATMRKADLLFHSGVGVIMSFVEQSHKATLCRLILMWCLWHSPATGRVIFLWLVCRRERKGGIPPAGSAPGRTGVIIPLALTHSLQRNRSLLIDCFLHFQGTVGFSFIAPSDNMSRILYYPQTAVKFSKHKRLICKNERHLQTQFLS